MRGLRLRPNRTELAALLPEENSEAAAALARAWSSASQDADRVEKWYAEALGSWLAKYKNENTRESYRRTIGHFFWFVERLRGSGRLVPPHEITEADVRGYVTFLADGMDTPQARFERDPMAKTVLVAVEEASRASAAPVEWQAVYRHAPELQPHDVLRTLRLLARKGAIESVPDYRSAFDAAIAAARAEAQAQGKRRIQWLPKLDPTAFRYRAKTSGTKASPATIQQRLSAVSSFFAEMIRPRAGWDTSFRVPVTGNPASVMLREAVKKTRLESEHRTARVKSTPDEFRLLMRLAEVEVKSSIVRARDVLVFVILLDMGLRVSELCEAKNKDVMSGVLTVTRKGGRVQDIGIPSEALQVLAAYREAVAGAFDPVIAGKMLLPDAPLVAAVGRRGFSAAAVADLGPAAPLTRWGVEEMFRRYASMAVRSQDPIVQEILAKYWVGLPPGVASRDAVERALSKRLHPHGLRHLHAARSEQAGIPIRDVAAGLGHASTSTTERVYLPQVDTATPRQGLAGEILSSAPRSPVQVVAPPPGPAAAAPAEVSPKPAQAPKGQPQPTSRPAAGGGPVIASVDVSSESPSPSPETGGIVAFTEAQPEAALFPPSPVAAYEHRPVVSTATAIDAVTANGRGRLMNYAHLVTGQVSLLPYYVVADSSRSGGDPYANRYFVPVPCLNPQVDTDLVALREGAEELYNNLIAASRPSEAAALTRWVFHLLAKGRELELCMRGTGTVEKPKVPSLITEVEFQRGEQKLLSAFGSRLGSTSTVEALAALGVAGNEKVLVRVYDAYPNTALMSGIASKGGIARDAIKQIAILRHSRAVASWKSEVKSSGRKEWISFSQIAPAKRSGEREADYVERIRGNVVRAHSCVSGILPWLGENGMQWSGSFDPKQDPHEYAVSTDANAALATSAASSTIADRATTGSGGRFLGMAKYTPPDWMLRTDDPLGSPEFGIPTGERDDFESWIQASLVASDVVADPVRDAELLGGDQTAKDLHKALATADTFVEYSGSRILPAADYADARAEWVLDRRAAVTLTQAVNSIVRERGWPGYYETKVGSAMSRLRSFDASLPFDQWRPMLFALAGKTDPRSVGKAVSKFLEVGTKTWSIFDLCRYDTVARTVVHDIEARRAFIERFGVDPQLVARRVVRQTWEMRKAAGKTTTTSAAAFATMANLLLSWHVPDVETMREFAKEIGTYGSGAGVEGLRKAWEQIASVEELIARADHREIDIRLRAMGDGRPQGLGEAVAELQREASDPFVEGTAQEALEAQREQGRKAARGDLTSMGPKPENLLKNSSDPLGKSLRLLAIALRAPKLPAVRGDMRRNAKEPERVVDVAELARVKINPVTAAFLVMS